MRNFAGFVVVIGVACLSACGGEENAGGNGRPPSEPPRVRNAAPRYQHTGGVRYVRQGMHWYKWYMEGRASKWERVPDVLVPAGVLKEHADRFGAPARSSTREGQVTLLPTVPEPKIPGEAGKILDRLRTLGEECFEILTEAASAGDMSDAAYARLREVKREMGSFGCRPRAQFPTPPELQPEDWFSPQWLGRLQKHLFYEMRAREPGTLTEEERRGSSWPELEMRLYFVLARLAAVENIRRGEYEGAINPFGDPMVPALWERADRLFDTYAHNHRSGSAYTAFNVKIKELAPRVGLTEVDVDRRVRQIWLEKRQDARVKPR